MNLIPNRSPFVERVKEKWRPSVRSRLKRVPPRSRLKWIASVKVRPARRELTFDPPQRPEERRDEIASQKGVSIRLRTASRMMNPSEAHSLIENELAPAMLAMVERAHGGRHATGYYSALAVGHVCLVLPRELEGLTLTQLERLDRSSRRSLSARDERLPINNRQPRNTAATRCRRATEHVHAHPPHPQPRVTDRALLRKPSASLGLRRIGPETLEFRQPRRP